ncbi:unnamed protein product [Tuber melanosporum]|uniref:(Perigord truffle) hypothetical protein n=1 Tax=Tuber melanosporum (strain Mel28) TaxID=656061 RepID=D5GNT9_TUBMM|nr:uncharacterized protein GSTUM_00011478001 [Tuber melanosporum]CAZ86182.1 unnamed protein product [Tuber melanosporum]
MGLRLRQKSPSPSRSSQQQEQHRQQQPSPPPTPQPRKSLRKARKNTHRSRSRSPSGLDAAIVLPNNIIPYGVLFQDDEPEDEGYSSPPSTPTDPPPHMQMDGWRMVPERGLAMELMFGNMDADLIEEIIGASSSDDMDIDEPATPSNTRTNTRIPHTHLNSGPSSEASSSSSRDSRGRRYSGNGFGGRVVDENYD